MIKDDGQDTPEPDTRNLKVTVEFHLYTNQDGLESLKKAFAKLRECEVNLYPGDDKPRLTDALVKLYARERNSEYVYPSSNFKPASQSQVRRDIEKLSNEVAVLLATFNQTHKTTIDVLEQNGWDVKEFRLKLAIASAAFLDTDNIDLSHIPERLATGRKPKVNACRIAERLAENFKQVTGKEPAITIDPMTNSASGIYYELIRDVFGALAITANPERMAKNALNGKYQKDKTPKKI